MKQAYRRRVDLDDFPPRLKGLVGIPYDSNTEIYKIYFDTLTLEELQECMKILKELYPGGSQIMRKNRIQAEINRRIRDRDRKSMQKRGTQMPRAGHWIEDFKILWERA